ncbi:hypothetical protein BH11ARM2_BH11ARM2_30390 [soil metagenome]
MKPGEAANRKAMEETVEKLIASEDLVTFVHEKLIVAALGCLPNDLRAAFEKAVISWPNIGDPRLLRETIDKSVYDAAQAATYYMPAEEAEKTMGLLEQLPDPYYIDPEKEREGLITWSERLPEAESTPVGAW